MQRLFPLSKAEPFLILSLLFVLHIIFVAGITYTNSRYRLPAALIFMVHTTYYGDLVLARLTGMRKPLRLARARMLNTEVIPGDLVETWKLQARILLESFDRSPVIRNHMEHGDDQFPFVSYRTKELQ